MSRLLSTSLLPLSWCALSAFALAPATPAQAPKYLFSPAGAEFMQAGSGNTIPWWSRSSTYQQIHDYDEMVAVAGGRPLPVVMKGLGFRPWRLNTLGGRTWDLRVAVGHSPNAAASASTTFANNLPKPTVVVATGTTFQKFSFKTVKGVNTAPGLNTAKPNPVGFTIPFKSRFVYIPLKNNHFCWELRYMNATSTSFMFTDAIINLSSRGIVKASVGSGCGNAKSTASVVRVSNTAFNYQTQLSGAPGGAQALMMVGLQRKKTQLPGWCSALETVPLLLLNGGTNGSGVWTFQAALASARNVPSFELLVQYAFIDKSQGVGIGLSDMSVYQTPLRTPPLLSGVATPRSTSNNTLAAATTGNISRVFGQVVGFQQ